MLFVQQYSYCTVLVYSSTVVHTYHTSNSTYYKSYRYLVTYYVRYEYQYSVLLVLYYCSTVQYSAVRYHSSALTMIYGRAPFLCTHLHQDYKQSTISDSTFYNEDINDAVIQKIYNKDTDSHAPFLWTHLQHHEQEYIKYVRVLVVHCIISDSNNFSAPQRNDQVVRLTNNSHPTDLLLYFSNATLDSNALITTPLFKPQQQTPNKQQKIANKEAI